MAYPTAWRGGRGSAVAAGFQGGNAANMARVAALLGLASSGARVSGPARVPPLGPAMYALLAVYVAKSVYDMTQRGGAGTMHHPGFNKVNHCSDVQPQARLSLGSPWPCLTLIATGGFEVPLNAPYTVTDKATGFGEIWLSNPGVGRWSHTSTWSPAGNPADNPATITDPDATPWPFRPHHWLRNLPFPRAVDVIRGEGAAAGVPSAAYPSPLDPAATKIGGMAPRAWFAPWRLVNEVNARAAAAGVWPETRQTERNPPIAATGTVGVTGIRERERTESGAVPQRLIVDRATGTSVQARSQPVLRAGARTHERKARVTRGQTQGFALYVAMVKRGFGKATEFSDFVENMYEALPLDLRQQLWRENGRHKLGTAKQMEALYRHYRMIDLNKAAWNVLGDEVQDGLIGMASSGIVEATGGSPLAMTISRFTRVQQSLKGS